MNNNEMENKEINTKEKKSKKRKFSKQMTMSIIMTIVSVVILSVSTYAWYLISNTPKAKNIKLKADTLGDLWIANEKADENAPDEYAEEIDLINEKNSNNNLYLSPVTTTDGINFHRPVYKEGKVDSVVALDNEKDKELIQKKYVYEKTFYLRAGDKINKPLAAEAKNYDIFLVGKTTSEVNGCYMYDSRIVESAEKINSEKDNTAANSIRVSLTFDGILEEDGKTSKTIIYEPNSDISSTSKNKADINATLISTYNKYNSIKQNNDKTFISPGETSRSSSLCTIKEGEDVKVTMKIWIEGMDNDCVNEIATDNIAGQIQFISEENLSQFKTTTTQ